MLDNIRAYLGSLPLAGPLVTLALGILGFLGSRSNARHASRATALQSRETTYYASLERRLEFLETRDMAKDTEIIEVRKGILECLADRNNLGQQCGELTRQLAAANERFAIHDATSAAQLATANARIAALTQTNELLVAANGEMVLRLLALEREVSDPSNRATVVERLASLETHEDGTP